MFSITFSHKSPISYHIYISYIIVIMHHHIYHCHISPSFIHHHISFSHKKTHIMPPPRAWHTSWLLARALTRATQPRSASIPTRAWCCFGGRLGISQYFNRPGKSLEIHYKMRVSRWETPGSGDFNRKPYGSPRTWGNSWTFKRLQAVVMAKHDHGLVAMAVMVHTV